FVGGTLIVADDGGLSRFNAGTARWQSMNGNLAMTELLSVAYNADTNQLIGGAQDVGVGVQVATSKTWNVPNDSTGSPSVGDGGIVQVGQVVGAADRTFYSSQRLLGFSMEAGGVITAP